MADKGEDECSKSFARSSDTNDNADTEIDEAGFPSSPPNDSEENSEDASGAIEKILEQVAASSSGTKDSCNKVKDKEREVKRASKMIIPPECKCHLNNGRPCHTRFTVGELMDTRMHYMSISKKELDIAVLAKLECGIHLSRMTTRKKRKPTERKKHRTDFYHHGYRICNLMFVYLHGFSYKKLKALIIQYKTNGVKTRIHKNLKPKPPEGERKVKKKTVKPKPKLKVKGKKAPAKNMKQKMVVTEQKKNKESPETQNTQAAVSQTVSQAPESVLHQPPPQCPRAAVFSVPNQQNPLPQAAFPIAAKHNPPAFHHFTNTAVLSHHPMAGHSVQPWGDGRKQQTIVSSHNNSALDYAGQTQRIMGNPTIDFSGQRTNPSQLAVFSGTNPQCLTYSVVHSVNF